MRSTIYKILGAGLIITFSIVAFACTKAVDTAPGLAGALSPPVVAATPEELAELLKPKGKPLVINHWATWCGPCVDELPYLSSIALKYSGKIDFIGVAWDNLNAAKAQDFIADGVNRVRTKTGASFHTIIAPPDMSEMAKKLNLLSESVPQTFVISKSGKRIWSFLGEIIEDSDKEDFTKAIEKALKE